MILTSCPSLNATTSTFSYDELRKKLNESFHCNSSLPECSIEAELENVSVFELVRF